MNERMNFRWLPAVVLAGLSVLIASSGGCSAAQQAASGQSCGALDTTSQAQATLKAWADAVEAVNTTATRVEGEWLKACNDLNAALSLDTSKKTAADACAVLKAHIQTDLQTKGVTLVLTVQPPTCQADLSLQASCEAKCKVDANCDITAHCTGGEVVVGCTGSCSGKCDVKDPTLTCDGTCAGECTASAAVSCSGECTGQCDAPTWTGTCDAGCTATFTGSCGGNCTGTCDGTTASGAKCAGKCVGSCDAKATGQCGAKCTGTFSGGKCSGMCTGTCNVAAGATCNGSCKGTCTYTPGYAMCSGECHGTCTGTATAPTCTGTVDCSASAECHGDCQAQAQASLNCSPPQVGLDIEGDDALASAFEKYIGEIGAAYNDTLALKDLLTPLAGKTASAFSAIGSIGLAGAACVTSELQVAASASVSINVSISASATVSGGA